MFPHSDSVGAVTKCEVSPQVAEAGVAVSLPRRVGPSLRPFNTPERL
jgi:hypothetical protein